MGRSRCYIPSLALSKEQKFLVECVLDEKGLSHHRQSVVAQQQQQQSLPSPTPSDAQADRSLGLSWRLELISDGPVNVSQDLSRAEQLNAIKA